VAQRLASLRGTLETKAAQVESLSPLAVLARGYTVTRRVADGKVVRSAGDIAAGDRIATQTADGQVTSIVERA
jgi:exodeoxyribonuclease VII large subunit